MRFIDLHSGFTREKTLPLKALLAILIVADHLTFWMGASWLTPFRELGAPIVSVFLFISGFGLMKSYMNKGAEYLDGFVRRRIWSVILPALVALAAYWLICFDPQRDYIRSIGLLFTHGVPLLPYSWYVATIVVLYLMFFLSFRYVPERYKALTVCLLSIVYIFVTQSIGYDRCWWVGTLAFPTGLLYAKYEKDISAFAYRSLVSITVVTMSLAALFICLFMTGSEHAYIACYILIPTMVALVYSNVRPPFQESRAVAFIGGISYEIYLCQGISMEFLRHIISTDILFLVCVYAMTIALATIVKKISFLLYR